MRGIKGFILAMFMAVLLLLAAGPVCAGSLHLYYSTYLGGGGNEEGYGIAVDGSGNAYVTGLTESTDFPTEHAFQGTYGDGVVDAFVTKLDPGGTALIYSTYLGGGQVDYGYGIAVDGTGHAHVTGGTKSSDFPKRQAFVLQYYL